MSDPETTAAPRRASWTRMIPLFVIGALFIGLLASGVLRQLSLHEIAAHHAELTRLVARHPVETLIGYIGVYVLVVVACVPGPSVMAVVGGFLFGVWVGGAAALASATVGAVLVFLACRTAFGDWAATRAGSMAARIEAGFSSNAFFYLLALRLMPIAPMFMVNIAAGLARVRLSSLVFATLIGALPASFIFAGLGAGLGEAIHRHQHLDMGLFRRPEIILPLAGLALISITPPLWRLWRGRRR